MDCNIVHTCTKRINNDVVSVNKKSKSLEISNKSTKMTTGRKIKAGRIMKDKITMDKKTGKSRMGQNVKNKKEDTTSKEMDWEEIIEETDSYNSGQVRNIQEISDIEVNSGSSGIKMLDKHKAQKEKEGNKNETNRNRNEVRSICYEKMIRDKGVLRYLEEGEK